jgi:hypothetical protein
VVRLYFDNDVSRYLASHLVALDHSVTTALGLGLTAASDDIHLLTATRRQHILVTHNGHDFMLLHRAWLRWPTAFDLAFPPHSGILVLDQRPFTAVQEQRDALYALFSQLPSTSLENQLLWWHGASGWRQLEDTGWNPI